MRPKLQACVDAIGGGPSPPTSSTAASRTRCCWSCSPTPASARWSPPDRDEADRPAGARAHYLMQTYVRGAGRVRARRGGAALGRRRQGVPRLPHRDLGLLGRPLPPRRGRGGPRAGRAPDPRLQPLLHRAGGAAGRAALRVEPRRPAFLSNSGTEANECAIKLARKHAHGRGIDEPEIVSFDRAFHGRTMGSLAATPALAATPLRPDAGRLRARCRATTPMPSATPSGETPRR